MKKIIVVGGGVSGVVFTIFAALKNPQDKFIIIEKTDDLCKRILVSGNGRCNFYNLHYANNDNFDDKYFETVNKICEKHYGKEFFNQIRELLDVDFYLEDDRFYPLSNKSETIHKLLIDKLKSLKNVEIINDELLKIDTKNQIIECMRTSYNFDFLVLSVGGMSYNYTKFNYSLFDNLKVNYTKFTPSLCPVKIKNYNYKKYSGTRFFATIKLLENNKLKYQETGEILLKDDGFSGVCIFNSTTFIDAKKLNNYTYKVELNSHHNKTFNLTSKNMYNYLPLKLCDFITEFGKNCNMNVDKVFDNLYFKIDSLYDFKFSQVSKGGISVNEINFETMTLKNNNKICVLGELIDISLPCGGYNLGLCMIEAYKAAIKN